MKDEEIGFLETLLMMFVVCSVLMSLLILYPFWRLFVWIVNLVGVSGIRNTAGNIETPVVFYEHPETKRRIVFIATIHIAETEYFAALQQLIESLSGYKILFEGVGRLSLQEEQALTEKERDVARHFDYIFRSVRKICEMMSLQYQKDGLAYEPGWINTDLRMYNLIQLFARHDVHFSEEEKKRRDDLFIGESNQLFAKWFVNMLFSRFVPVVIIVDALSFFSRDKRLAKKFILEFRNEEALRGINTYLAEGNVATIWGAGHLRGIDKRLKQAGFREIRREWFVAYRVRDYSFFQGFKKLIADGKITAGAATASKKD